MRAKKDKPGKGCPLVLMLALLVIPVANVHSIEMRQPTSIQNNMNLKGTLIATVITKSKIYLLSDGRVIDRDSGTVHNKWSKVHKLTDRVGMLTAGAYVPNLRDDIARNCEERKFRYVNEVAALTSLLLQEMWKRFTSKIENRDKIKKAKISIFIAGYDEGGNPHLFYVDSHSQPAFRIQEQPLFQSGNDFEIGAMSTASGQTEDPTAMLVSRIGSYLNRNKMQFSQSVFSAFNDTKEELALKHRSIGGETFIAEIDYKGGYKELSEEYKQIGSTLAGRQEVISVYE